MPRAGPHVERSAASAGCAWGLPPARGLAVQGWVAKRPKGGGKFRAYQLGDSEGDEEAVGDALDVLLHQGGVHADEVHGQGVADEFLLAFHGLGHQRGHLFGMESGLDATGDRVPRCEFDAVSSLQM